MIQIRRTMLTAAALLVMTFGATVPAGAQEALVAGLGGLEEVPAISTTGAGVFLGTVSSDETSMTYKLRYLGLEGQDVLLVIEL